MNFTAVDCTHFSSNP